MSTADIAAPPPSAASASPDSGRLEIDRFFQALVKFQGSDLHLKVGQPPIIRVKGSLQPLKTPPLDNEQMRRLCLPMLNERTQRILEVDGGCDFAHIATIDGVSAGGFASIC